MEIGFPQHLGLGSLEESPKDSSSKSSATCFQLLLVLLLCCRAEGFFDSAAFLVGTFACGLLLRVAFPFAIQYM
jgi:hypothetical protein